MKNLYNVCYYIKQQILIIFNQNNKLYIFFNNITLNLLIYSKVITFFKNLNCIYSSKLIMIGLGFKCFIYKNYLFLLLGFSHYILYKIPKEIKLFCKKKTIFLTSLNKQKLFIFHKVIQNSKKPNIYKGKGLIEFKQFKTFIKLKKGKKQQYI
jgi:large subunit ribosomal protein L6